MNSKKLPHAPEGANNDLDPDTNEDIGYYRNTAEKPHSMNRWKAGISIATVVFVMIIAWVAHQSIREHTSQGNPPDLFGMQDVPFHYKENPLITQGNIAIQRYMQGRCTSPPIGAKMDDYHYRVDCLVGNENHVFMIESYQQNGRWYLRHRVEY